jgi:hypothetical protein
MIAKEQDFYAWSQQAAACLRGSGELARELRNAIAEEIESLGKSEQRELYRRLSVILTHLLKWDAQPLKRSQSWRATLRVQRSDLARLLEQNPSLRARVNEELEPAYQRARELAAAQTGFEPETFPAACPYSADQVLGRDDE